MKGITWIGLVIISCLTMVLGGCTGQEKTPKITQQAGYTIQDYQGNAVKLIGKPQRIVSLTLGTDEMLLSLVGPSRLAALTKLADDPGITNVTEAAKQVPGRVKVNLESIISLQPDLVILADWQPIELSQSIKEAGIAVYVYKTPSTIQEVKQVITELARLVGEEAKGKELVTTIDRDLAAVTEKVKNIPPNKRQVVIRYTLLGATYGTGSLFDDICKYANVENGVSKAGGKMFEYLPKEKIIGVNPDILLLPAWDFAGKRDLEEFRRDVQQDLAFQSLNAVKNNKLLMVADKNISAASQYITLGVKDVAVAAYPEYF